MCGSWLPVSEVVLAGLDDERESAVDGGAVLLLLGGHRTVRDLSEAGLKTLNIFGISSFIGRKTDWIKNYRGIYSSSGAMARV